MSVHKDELKLSIQAIERAQVICCNDVGSLQLTVDIGVLYQCIRYVNFCSDFCVLSNIQNLLSSAH